MSKRVQRSYYYTSYEMTLMREREKQMIREFSAHGTLRGGKGSRREEKGRLSAPLLRCVPERQAAFGAFEISSWNLTGPRDFCPVASVNSPLTGERLL